jgi:radical SAM superfamily enzyme YgiQ (UPF0313 family)
MSRTFVIREDGRWLLAPVAGDTPTPADLATVEAILAPSPPSPEAAPGTTVGPTPLTDEDVVGPVWSLVGLATAGGLLLEGNDGVVRLLDRGDLGLLDRLDRPTRVADLSVGGPTDTAARLGGMVAMGRLRRLPPEALDQPVVPRASTPAPPPVPAPRSPAVVAPAAEPRRIGVHAVWQRKVGPALSVGVLTASARRWQGGALGERFAIHRPEAPEELLAALEAEGGPAVLLCSNYLWSIDHNLDVARRAKARCPDLLVIHGGPSTPKYPGDAERFLTEHAGVADVLVRGEGEVTLCLLLEALTDDLGLAGLETVPGLTFRHPTDGRVVRTPDPERIADLDTIPSPYLTGEFDHIDPSAWVTAVSVETNRGCPYGCTFCDWGSATLSRIRKFEVDRVLGEIEWAAARGIGGIQICDANFGIMARDVEIAEGLAEIRRRHGCPHGVGLTPPKNTTKHVTRILDALLDSGCLVSTAISLQSVDAGVLDAVQRSNISTDNYLALAADLRRRGQPLTGDVLIGIPGQTYATYKADLQFFVDHEIMARTWAVKVLPNAPMNDPEYRERWRIETDDTGLVVSTSTFDRDDLRAMLRLRKVEVIAYRLGVIRQLGRFLQWDHGVAMTDLLDHLIEVTTTTPERFPLLTWVLEYFDLHPTVAVGWHSFEAELRRLLTEDYDLDPTTTDLDTVLRLQTHLLPAPERTFPATITLDHDYLAYYRDTTATLHTTGHAGTPPRPLADYPPAPFTVDGDPLKLCTVGLHFDGDSRDHVFEGDFCIGQASANELDSPLLSLLPVFGGREGPVDGAAREAEIVAGLPTPVPQPQAPERAFIRSRRAVGVERG